MKEDINQHIEYINSVILAGNIPTEPDRHSSKKDRHTTRRYRSTDRPIMHDIVTDVIYDGTNNRHCYLIDHMPENSYIKLQSADNPGLYNIGKNHLVHNSSSKSETYIEAASYPEYREIREAVQRLTGWSDNRLSYHPSGNARDVDRWVGFFFPKLSPSQARKLLPDYSCREINGPVQLPYAYYHDMVSAYWQIAEAIPHPFIYMDRLSPSGLRYMKLGERIYTKWRTMIEAMKPHKKACKAIIGNWIAGYSNEQHFDHSTRLIYHKGKVYKAPQDPRNRLNTFGLLVVRITKELTQEEFIQDNGHLAYVDCVITESDIATYWESQNIIYQTKGRGPTDIVHLYCHKVGERLTVPYENHEVRMEKGKKYKTIKETDHNKLAEIASHSRTPELYKRLMRIPQNQTNFHAPRIPRDQYYHTHLTFGGH